MASEMIYDHGNGLFFENVYLITKILSKANSTRPVSHLCHFIIILSNHSQIPIFFFLFFFFFFFFAGK